MKTTLDIAEKINLCIVILVCAATIVSAFLASPVKSIMQNITATGLFVFTINSLLLVLWRARLANEAEETGGANEQKAGK